MTSKNYYQVKKEYIKFLRSERFYRKNNLLFYGNILEKTNLLDESIIFLLGYLRLLQKY